MASFLIVDDAKIMRLNIKNILLKLGHTVVAQATNGYEAIEKYKTFKPDMVTMDITMPQNQGIVDGIVAVKQIKDYDANAKIIMITSHGEENNVIRAIKNGAANYILKPVDPNRLNDVINKVAKS